MIYIIIGSILTIIAMVILLDGINK